MIAQAIQAVRAVTASPTLPEIERLSRHPQTNPSLPEKRSLIWLQTLSKNSCMRKTRVKSFGASILLAVTKVPPLAQAMSKEARWMAIRLSNAVRVWRHSIRMGHRSSVRLSI